MTFELDTRALRYFTAVAERGSYSLAAAHLRITQPAVSRQVQAIEKAYGVRLFRQEGRRMVLTEAGKLLQDQARELVGRLDDIGSLLKSAADEPVGRVSVGVTTSPAEILMPEIVQRYREKYPRVFLHIQQGSSAELREWLTQCKLDVALIYGQAGQAGQGAPTMRPLVDLQIGLVAPPPGVIAGTDPIAGATEISLERAASLPLIFPGPNELLRVALEQAFARIGVTPNIVLESDSLLLTKALIRAGVGYMLVGYVGVHGEVRQGALRFVPLSPPGMAWRMSLALRGSKAPSLAVRAMAAEITAAIERGVQGDDWRGVLLL